MIDLLLVVLALASVFSVGLLFLPAIVELKKPQDAGPRLITGVLGQTNPTKMAWHNLDDEPKIEGPSSGGVPDDFSDSAKK